MHTRTRASGHVAHDLGGFQLFRYCAPQASAASGVRLESFYVNQAVGIKSEMVFQMQGCATECGRAANTREDDAPIINHY